MITVICRDTLDQSSADWILDSLVFTFIPEVGLSTQKKNVIFTWNTTLKLQHNGKGRFMVKP